MNEAETRADHIDPAHEAAGWGVVEGRGIRREYPITLGRIEGQGRGGKPCCSSSNTTTPSPMPSPIWERPRKVVWFRGRVTGRATAVSAVLGVTLRPGVPYLAHG